MVESSDDIERVSNTLRTVLNSCGIDKDHRILITEEGRVATTVMNGELLNDAIVNKFKAKVTIDYESLNLQLL